MESHLAHTDLFVGLLLFGGGTSLLRWFRQGEVGVEAAEHARVGPLRQRRLLPDQRDFTVNRLEVLHLRKSSRNSCEQDANRKTYSICTTDALHC